jgi:hypothetical protein
MELLQHFEQNTEEGRGFSMGLTRKKGINPVPKMAIQWNMMDI